MTSAPPGSPYGAVSWARVDGGMRVVLSGEIDYSCRAQLAGALMAVADTMPGNALVHLADVTFCSSEAIGFLAGMTRIVVNDHGGTLSLHNPSRATARLVAMFEMLDRITVTRD